MKISRSHPELVSNIGLCNFDAVHTEEACLHILSEIGEVGLVSNQVQVKFCLASAGVTLFMIALQYSLIDSRPSIQLAEVCNKYQLKILTYGSLCGGFIAEKWLGVEAPDIYSESLQLTPSQRKVRSSFEIHNNKLTCISIIYSISI